MTKVNCCRFISPVCLIEMPASRVHKCFVGISIRFRKYLSPSILTSGFHAKHYKEVGIECIVVIFRLSGKQEIWSVIPFSSCLCFGS